LTPEQQRDRLEELLVQMGLETVRQTRRTRFPAANAGAWKSRAR